MLSESILLTVNLRLKFDSYISFKIGIPDRLCDRVYWLEFWPEGPLLKEFISIPKKQCFFEKFNTLNPYYMIDNKVIRIF